MEIRDILKNNDIIGVIGNYKSSLNGDLKVKDLHIKNIGKGLKIVGLEEDILAKKVNELTISEKWKIDLLTKIHKDTIIVGNLSNNLIYKDREFMKKLFKKLNNNYHKKIIIIDNQVDVFINLVAEVVVTKNKQVIYETKDFFDSKLYNYVKKPKIIDFIDYANKNEIRLTKNVEIYELIKDIYRRNS